MSPLFAILLAVSAAAAEETPTSVYCTPSDACWPSDAAWDELATALDGDLYAVDPDAEYGQCLACGTDAYCLTGASRGICMHDFSCARGFCQDDAAWDTPARVAEVASAADVSKVVAFAHAHDIPVSVKTSGHSYTGSSLSKDSLLVWTRGLPHLGDVTPGPYVDSCGGPVDAAATVEVGGGALWYDAYNAVGSDYHFIGGHCLTVSAAGGWLLGGGLSSSSRLYGLGVDNVLRIDLVLADGTAAFADACTEPELFWALRGGGGGTLGVVTSVVYKLYPPQPMVSLEVVLAGLGNPMMGGSAAQSRAMVEFWLDAAPGLDPRWGGYWSTFNLLLYFSGSEADARATFIDAFDAWLAANADPYPWFYSVTEAPSYFDVRGDAMGDPSSNPATGENWHPSKSSSRLVPQAAAESTEFKDLVLGFVDAGALGTQNYLLGGAVGDVAPGATAVHRALREGALYTIETTTPAASDALRALLPNGVTGVSYNHHGPLEPDWRVAAWGDNYDRVLAAKERYDPAGTFNCWHCAGYRGPEMEQGDPIPAPYDCQTPCVDDAACAAGEACVVAGDDSPTTDRAPFMCGNCLDGVAPTTRGLLFGHRLDDDGAAPPTGCCRPAA